MKTIVLALTLIGLMSSFADDSFLYWMVGSAAEGSGYSDYATVKVRAIGGDTDAGDQYLQIGWNTAGGVFDGYGSLPSTAFSSSTPLYASLANYAGSGYSYVIELFNSDGKFLAESTDHYSYSELVAMNSISSDLKSLMTAYSPSSYAVPEPNSVVLLLLGCAGLALRRRRLMHA